MAAMMGADTVVTEVDPAYSWIWRAWHRLTHERQWQTRGVSMSMGGSVITPFPVPIPWSAVHLWCEARDYGEAEELFMDTCIGAMDGVFVEWYSAQVNKKN